jgi:2-amino-4-hydroxy-6-hydroxymethyldihydropteridine diphosphokinase
VLKEIEKNAGRKEKTSLNDYSSRELDIDIIYCDDLVLELEELKIPHPLRLSRNFVLVPLSDIAPDFIDPLERKSVEVLRNKCIDVVKVEKLERFV